MNRANLRFPFAFTNRKVWREEKQMERKVVVAILICAVMVLIAAIPLAAADTHYVLKGDQGPRASAVTWEYVPADYRVWNGHIVNNGLRSLVVDVYDNTSGVPEQISHQKIRFAAYDAYPLGTVDTAGVIMAPTHKYLISVTPSGPKGSSCTVDDQWTGSPPVAMFTIVIGHLAVIVDGSSSYDADGSIVSYAWDFGDGSTATGMTATHTYAEIGYYTITLTVTDNDGFTGSASKHAGWPPVPPPVAMFTVSVNGMDVVVDGSGSFDADGMIVSYAWDFGDGAADVGVTASHTYATEGEYTITLAVTDDDGGIGSASEQVTIVRPSPLWADFTCTVDGLTVNVDASASSSDHGIVSYEWDWGDGTTGNGVTASHTYSMAKSVPTDSMALSGATRGPGPPFTAFGWTYAPDGVTPLPDCTVTVIDLRTGYTATTVSSCLTGEEGYYTVNWLQIDGGWMPGDVINVTAVNGDLIGWSEAVSTEEWIWLDVTLTESVEPIVRTITLTVTDTIGRTGSISQTVTLYP